MPFTEEKLTLYLFGGHTVLRQRRSAAAKRKTISIFEVVFRHWQSATPKFVPKKDRTFPSTEKTCRVLIGWENEVKFQPLILFIQIFSVTKQPDLVNLQRRYPVDFEYWSKFSSSSCERPGSSNDNDFPRKPYISLEVAAVTKAGLFEQTFGSNPNHSKPPRSPWTKGRSISSVGAQNMETRGCQRVLIWAILNFTWRKTSISWQKRLSMSSMRIHLSGAQFSSWTTNNFVFLGVWPWDSIFWIDTDINSGCYWRCLMSWHVMLKQKCVYVHTW